VSAADPWVLVRFLHILGATVWVGGQLSVSFVVRPVAIRILEPQRALDVVGSVGRRFGVLTVAAFLPLQVGTGTALAAHAGVTWESLLSGQVGYDQILASKLLVFAVVMAAAAGHGWASATGRPYLARALAMTSLVASVAVVWLASALPGA
jgi:uncharacterized membrane protein